MPDEHARSADEHARGGVAVASVEMVPFVTVGTATEPEVWVVPPRRKLAWRYAT